MGSGPTKWRRCVANFIALLFLLRYITFYVPKPFFVCLLTVSHIHSPATLLGTPVQLLGNTNC